MPRDPRTTTERQRVTTPTGYRSGQRTLHRQATPSSPRTARPNAESKTETKLRLVGTGAPDIKPPAVNPAPITQPTDPRWVLAIRTAQVIQGSTLPPAQRETLMRLGKSIGLSAFDCSLILAIIQDRARRGIALDQCPAESERQLALIPLPKMRSFQSALGKHPVQTIMIASGLIALQVLLIWALLST